MKDSLLSAENELMTHSVQKQTNRKPKTKISGDRNMGDGLQGAENETHLVYSCGGRT